LDGEIHVNFVVIGTDHRMQHSERGLEALLRAFLEQRYFEPLQAIAEEYSDDIGESIAQRIVQERKQHGMRWYNLDMTTDEKHDAGILEEQRARPAPKNGVTFRVPSDDVREDAWVEKLVNSALGTTLVICGYLHYEALVGKLRQKGHTVDKRVHLETVPEIKLWHL
jgi:hypothetical protein